jgi:uncharacterized membrane protein YeaQ/YmgE (transglycosylase-associated protein family)
MTWWLWYLIVGLLAGAFAKALMPGNRYEPQGCLMTLLLGIAGAMITGFILHDVFHMTTSNGFIGSIIGATLGAMLLIWLFRKFGRGAT